MLYENTEENQKTIGWGYLPEHVYGQPGAKYVWHDYEMGVFIRTNQKTFAYCYVYGQMFVAVSMDLVEMMITRYESSKEGSNRRAQSYIIHLVRNGR
jgi:hypothetical protein